MPLAKVCRGSNSELCSSCHGSGTKCAETLATLGRCLALSGGDVKLTLMFAICLTASTITVLARSCGLSMLVPATG